MSITENVVGIPQQSNSSISIYNKHNQQWQTQDLEETTKITNPFHLLTSQYERKQNGFTPYGSEQYSIKYSKIETVQQFYEAVLFDCCSSLFLHNWRKDKHFQKSDVVVFDIDNDAGPPDEKPDWDDKKSWLTIDQFTEKFIDYEFLITTSVNHKKQKGDREARPKYHAFMPLSHIISNGEKIQEYADLIDWLIATTKNNPDKKYLDSAVSYYSSVWGNPDTHIYYNQGGAVNELLHKNDIQAGYHRDRGDITRHGNSGSSKDVSTGGFDASSSHTDGLESSTARRSGTDSSDYETDWDYINLLSKLENFEIFGDITSKTNGGWMARCELHDDKNPSLKIHHNYGWQCYSGSCLKNNVSGLEYLAQKHKVDIKHIRQGLCDKFKVDINDYRIWCSEKESNKPQGLKKLFSSDEPELFFRTVYAESEEYTCDVNSIGTQKVTPDTYKKLQKLNQEHAILVHNGKTSILRRGTYIDDNKVIPIMETTRLQDFRDSRKNEIVRVLQKKSGKDEFKSIDMGTLWLGWDKRREYPDGKIISPTDERGTFGGKRVWDLWDDWESATFENKWKGDPNRRGIIRFLDQEKLNGVKNIEDAVSKCSWFLALINKLISKYQGDTKDRLYRYIYGWLNRLVTNHNDRVTVALVLQGGQGTGKGQFVEKLSNLFGGDQRYFLHLQRAEELTQKHNDYMEDKMLCFVDEAIFAGDRSKVGTVKTKITERSHRIEPKFFPSYSVRNYMRFIYASNEDWAVNVDPDTRRYQIIDVGYERMPEFSDDDNELSYRKLDNQWHDGGKEAFYYFITSEVPTNFGKTIDFDKDKIITEAAGKQIVLSSPELQWYESILDDGGYKVVGSDLFNQFNMDEPTTIRDTSELYEHYQAFAKGRGLRFSKRKKGLTEQLKKFTEKKIVVFYPDRDYKTPTNKTVWVFGALTTMREHWNETLFNGIDQFTGYEDDEKPFTGKEKKNKGWSV